MPEAFGWADLPTLADLPAIFDSPDSRPDPRAAYHVRRAGFGVFTAVYLREATKDPRWQTYAAWKSDPIGQAATLDTMASALAAMLRAWSPVLPPDWIITAPPAAASRGRPYPAGILAREVAARLDLDYQTLLHRTDSKRGHHPLISLRQKPYRVQPVPAALTIILDDFIASGTTLRLARAALADVNVPSVAFAWGCD